jgi:hypothetical protein
MMAIASPRSRVRVYTIQHPIASQRPWQSLEALAGVDHPPRSRQIIVADSIDS